MANTLLQNPAVATFASAVSSFTATFGSPCTPGSLIIAAVTGENRVSTFTVADGANAGNYAADVFVATASGVTGCGIAGISSMQNTSSNALTVTVTISGGASIGTLKIYEISGQATSSVLDSSGTQQWNGAQTVKTVPITTLTAHTTIIAANYDYPGGAGVDTGFTSAFTEFGGTNGYHWGEYFIDSGAANTYALEFNLTAGVDGCAQVAAAYKTSAGGGASPILMGRQIFVLP